MIFKNVSELLNPFKVSLKVNRTTTETHYDVLQLQPRGNISYSNDCGAKCTDSNYGEKVIEFLNIAREEHAGLVITPEYSVPYNVIRDTIKDISKWPEQYNLWCLCAEGIATSEFKALIATLQKDTRLNVCIEAGITYKKYVNALWYIFRINQEKLAIIIQLKIHPMSDREISHEANDLSNGDTIYIFDLNSDNNTKNILLSLICADALHIPNSELCSNIGANYPLIINPQLNEKPFHNDFVSGRNSFFGDTMTIKKRILTVNWAPCTKIINGFTIKEAGSAYYNYINANGKNHIDAIVTDRDHFEHRSSAQKQGVSYYCDTNKYNIWLFENNEEVFRYHIRKDDIYEINPALSPTKDPIIKESNVYNEHDERWDAFNECILNKECKELASMIIKDTGLEFPNLDMCENRTCREKCNLIYNDFFFGICFGGFSKEELQSINEMSNRTIKALNLSSGENSKKKRQLFRKLAELIVSDKFPESLFMYKGNCKFDMDENCAITGSNNIYNISVKRCEKGYENWQYKKGIFVILDTYDVGAVESLYNKICIITKPDYKDQIVIYYRTDGEEFSFYDVPHDGCKPNPRNTNFTKNTTSVFKGAMEYGNN